MSNLKKLLAERERRWLRNLEEVFHLTISQDIPWDAFRLAKRRYWIAHVDRVRADRGFVGESIAKPPFTN